MRPFRKIAFLFEEFSTPSPAQQLLDRFLMGYPRDGAFQKPEGLQVVAYLALATESNFGERPKDFDLSIAPTAEQAVADSDAVVIVSRRPGDLANEAFVKIALEQAPEGAVCFVHGALANSLVGAQVLARMAAARRIRLLAGTPISVTWRLPAVELPSGTPLAEALIVVQANPPSLQSTPSAPPSTLGGATLQGLDGLWPVLERRRGGESGIRHVRFLEGANLWRAGSKGLWSWPLLAAALSRSNSPQGDALIDGRTQDLVGLGLVPKLARHPRGWVLEHRDGLRTAILLLDGVVADCNFAVRPTGGEITSAQLFRAPPPAEHHFSRLAAVLEDFFRGGPMPWRVERSVIIAGLLETFRKPSSLSGERVNTPDLGMAYTPP